MKYKIVGIISMVLILIFSAAALMMTPDSDTNRVHQHLSGRKPSAGCNCDKKELCTHLPLVLIDTKGKKIPGEPIRDKYDRVKDYTVAEDGEPMVDVEVSVISDNGSNHHPSDKADLKSNGRIRIRGASSRSFDKKGYLLRLTKEDGSYNNEEMMGMAPHYEWALHGPYLDKSLIRNYMWYNISGEIMDYAPNVRFCEVVLNGKYQGLYVMAETIHSGKDCRLDLSEPVDSGDMSGYVIRVDRGSENPIKNIDTFSTYAYRNLQGESIYYPRSGKLTPELIKNITHDFSDFERGLYSYDYDTDKYGYHNDIDVKSFVDYFIINEFTSNYDAGYLSTYVYRDIGEKIGLVVWDFNSACENYREYVSKPNDFQFQNVVWYFMLMKDDYFTNRIVERYRELRKSWLSEEYLDNYIDETVEFLGPAINRNFKKWGYSFKEYKPLVPKKRNPRNYQEAIDQMKDFIDQRGSWMDDNIEVVKQFSHPSKNKKFNH